MLPFKSGLKPVYLLEGLSSLQTTSLGPAVSAADEIKACWEERQGIKG